MSISEVSVIFAIVVGKLNGFLRCNLCSFQGHEIANASRHLI